MEFTWNNDDRVWIWHQPKDGPFVVTNQFEQLDVPFTTVGGVYVDGYVVIKSTTGDKSELRYHKESIASSQALGTIVSVILVHVLIG